MRGKGISTSGPSSLPTKSGSWAHREGGQGGIKVPCARISVAFPGQFIGEDIDSRENRSIPPIPLEERRDVLRMSSQLESVAARPFPSAGMQVSTRSPRFNVGAAFGV